MTSIDSQIQQAKERFREASSIILQKTADSSGALITFSAKEVLAIAVSMLPFVDAAYKYKAAARGLEEEISQIKEQSAAVRELSLISFPPTAHVCLGRRE